ncbi:metallophosphoesterase family protein [Desulfovibrio inopinatus]|uniref:metallophosphoesterase family protein n=1 Tax=Desulfovibrio inopinatus TaxID=102109 RepID=UPI0003FA1067|nr:metallophosphoesterase [Desulfovibrio inopinatus]
MTTLPEIHTSGFFFIADAHLAGRPPGQRLEGYQEQILAKVEACLIEAAKRDMLPVFLGDLFHWPRENPNNLLVALIALFRDYTPYVLVGNHDKYEARLTTDVSLAVLEEAGVVHVMKEAGPVLRAHMPGANVVLGASPDGTPLPTHYDKEEDETVVWISHHGIGFPDFRDRPIRISEIPGVDWVVNGHIHRPQPTETCGQTRWANPGNIVRLTFSQRSLKRIPAASYWVPGCDDIEHWPVPHLPFYDVFPDQDFPVEPEGQSSESRFLEGLERLAWKRTREGVGLRQFLQDNLTPETPETELIWNLYKEVTDVQNK